MPATSPPPVHGPRTGPATQQDVALAAGVSRGLVSLALKGEGRMSDETRRRILRTARTLGYRTNTAAAELAARRSSRLAVIVPYLDNPFFDVLLRRRPESTTPPYPAASTDRQVAVTAVSTVLVISACLVALLCLIGISLHGVSVTS